MLDELGVRDTPSDEWVVQGLPIWAEAAERKAKERYLEISPKARRAHVGTIGYTAELAGPPIAALLTSLRGEPAAALTRILLEKHLPRVPGPVSVGGRGVEATEAKYPPIRAPHPLVVLLWAWGKWQIGQAVVFLAACWDLQEKLSDSGAPMEEIEAVGALLPSRDALTKAWPEGWPGYTADTGPVWKALLAARHSRDHDHLRPLWQAAARFNHAPTTVPFGDEEVPIADLFVSTMENEVKMATAAGHHAVQLDLETADTWIEAGAGDIDDLTELVVIDLQVEAVRLGDLVPGIDDYIADKSFTFNFARRIVSKLGSMENALSMHREEERLILSEEKWKAKGRSGQTRLLIEALDWFGALVDGTSVPDLLKELDLAAANELRSGIAKHPDLPSRLLAAAGSAQTLLDSLPEEASAVVEAGTDDLEIAELALDIHGTAALRAIRDQMEACGLRPPTRWGTAEAHAFVAELGFPPEFAGAGNPRLLSEIDIDGPVRLGQLHDYQKEALEQLGRVFRENNSPARRSVLSLPTGAGKTRVAVEAAVENVLRHSSSRPLVVWVAQTEELGEQAVEAFRQVWRNNGLEDKALRVCRLWGGLPTPQAGLDDQPTVVIALFQTLERRLYDGSARWLSSATLLIIDECHHAIAPSYTSILSGLGFATGAGLRRREDRRVAEPVLLGLSATPFRSAGDDESRLLAQRFGDRVMPINQSGLYDRLEQRGILSRISYAPIDADYGFRLEPDELRHLNEAQDLPESALARLSDIEERNERILDLVTEADEQSVLLFANSVWHATHLAARLSLRGVRSRVVHAQTDRSARRAAVAAFRSGDVQVICNAGVFATGFDAPKVDMVLISRPVFSPVRYLQMIGRGLRGPANGGTEFCKVVTLVDNIVDYGRTRGPEFWQGYYASWNQ
ncbi:MAG: DEAD/DEAH box helicase family protein [Sphingomonadaceae bacterium]